MSQPEPIILNFNAGELSPIIDARSDLKRYYSGCLTMENFLPLIEGPARSRPGEYYVGSAYSSTKESRLVNFQFSTVQGYVLEFSDLKMRVLKDGAIVVSAPGVPYELTTPYAEADLFELKMVQSADTMYIAHPDYAPRKLTRTGHAAWTLTVIDFAPPPTAVVNFSPNATLTLAATTGANILCTASAPVFLGGDVNRQIVSGAGKGSIISVVSTTQVRIDITQDFAAVGPIAINSWAIYGSFSSSLTPSIAEPKNAVTTLTSTGSTETKSSLVSTTYRWIASGSGTNEYYCELAAGGDPGISLPSKCYENSAEMVNGSLGTLGVQQWAYGDNDALGFSTVYVRLSDGTDPDTKAAGYVESSVVVAAASIFRSTDVGSYIRINGGFIKVTTFTSATSVKGQILKVLTDGITASTDWSLEGPVWSATLGYPSAVGFYEQRLGWAGSTTYPETVWLSVSQDYENHTEDPVEVDAAISYPLRNTSGKIDAINWIMGENSLLLGTVGGISKLGATNLIDPLSSENVNHRLQTSVGSKNLDAEMINDAIIYVQKGGTVVRRLQYDANSDKYQALDLTRLAKHITKGTTDALSGIVDWDVQITPFPLVWAIRADGVLLGMLYEPAEDMVVPWFRWTTDGLFESVAVESREGYEDRVWVIVTRTINGATVRNIEYFMPHELYGDIDNSCCVDSALTYSGAAATNVTGLSHLEGKTVAVVTANPTGATTRVVSGATLDRPLSYSATKITVGLPYYPTLKPMPIQPDLNGTGILGKKSKIIEAYAKFYQTYGGKVGSTVDDLKSIPFGTGTEAVLQEETVLLPYPDTDPSLEPPTIVIQQNLPWPMTVQSIKVRVEVTDG